MELTKEERARTATAPAVDSVAQERLLRLPEVLRMVSFSRATLYRRIENGEFPAPKKDGNISFWPLSVVAEWIEAKKNGGTFGGTSDEIQ
jgi:prophage regulatory protein